MRMLRALGGLFLIYSGLTWSPAGSDMLSLALAGLGVYLLATSRSRAAQEDDADSRRGRAASEPRRRETSRIPGHADLAMRNAGHDPRALALRVSDIGLFAISEGRETLVHRAQPLRDDEDHVQPWVRLRLPQAAAGTLRFEIRDMDDRLHFQRDRTLQLKAGDNLVSPTARMPVHDGLLTEGDWQLCVYADGNLLAAHSFFWVEAEEDAPARRLRVQVQEDGEMSEELRQAFEESAQMEERSLDELLDFQGRRA